MAKKPNGYYSPEAIIGRAQAAAYDKQKTQKAESQDATIPPPVAPVSLKQTLGEFVAQKKVVENTPAPKPYMATDVTKDGAPIYGHGIAGWARKAWADLTDPSKYFQDQDHLSQSVQDEIHKEYDAKIVSGGQIIEDKLNWSQWGEKIFGLTSEDLAALPAAGYAERKIAEESGQSVLGTSVARQVRLAVDTTQNFVWGGLAILGLDDSAMRKIHTTRIGIDAVADEFNKDANGGNFVQSLIAQGSTIGFAKDLFTIGTALTSGRLKWGDAVETVKKYQAGSEMAYSMIFDDAARKEFEKGIAEGKDPYMLSQNLGNIGWELGGSILGSPSTYLGAALLRPVNLFTKEGRAAGTVLKLFGKEVKLFGAVQRVPWQTIGRIPNFGEIIGTSIGKARVANEINRFTEIAIPGLEKVLSKANNVAGEAEAIKVLEESAATVTKHFDEQRMFKKWWNLAALDNNGKISVASRDASLFIQNMVASHGMDGALQTMRDMVISKSGGKPALEAAQRLMSRNTSSMIFSEVGNMVGEIVSRLDQARIADLVVKHADDPVKMHSALFAKLEGVLHDFIPSVDEMFAAEKAVKEAATSGAIVDGKTVQLAKMLDDVPDVVKLVNRSTRPLEVITKKTTSAMVYMFMNLVPRSWSRNIQGQFLPMAAQVGLKNAIEISMQAVLGLSKNKTTEVMLEGDARIAKILGYVPAEATFGIGKVGNAATKGAFSMGMLPAIQRSEKITANGIIYQEAMNFIDKSLGAVTKDLPEWDNLVNSLPKEQQGLFSAIFYRTHGNFDETVKLMREVVGKGEIEAWRVTEPSANMKKQLEQLGLMGNFYDAQRTAKTSTEFKTFVDDAIKAYQDTVTKGMLEVPWKVDSMPSQLNNFGVDLANKADPEQSRIIGGLIQSWQNTLGQLQQASDNVLRTARNMATDIAMQTQDKTLFNMVDELGAKLQTIGNATSNNYQEINILREEVARVVRSVDNNMSRADMARLFNTPIEIGGKEVFSLSKIYPQADLGVMDQRQFKHLVWTAFFENTAAKYRATNVGVYDRSMETFDEIAKLFGSTVDQMALSQKGENVFEKMAQFRQTTDQIEEAHAWQRFFRQLQFDNTVDNKALLKDVVGKFESLFPDWKGGQRHIVNAVNQGLETKIPYEEITLKQALTAIGKRTIVAPETASQLPTQIEGLYRGMKNFTTDIQSWSDEVVSGWGKKVKTLVPDVQDKLLAAKNALKPRMDYIKLEAGVSAVSTRNFILHDYNRTYMDHALTYLLGNSMHYWTTRTYTRAFETVLDNPKYANVYLSYKQYMAKKHADRPEWYRQNIQIGGLPGIDMGNQFFFNMEANINPIYGLTGVDFNDPRKRVDWVSRAVDDMNKMGPSFSPLISWAVAMHLYDKGEAEAGQRWAGRLLPQSSMVKSTSAALLGKPIEIDPFVNFLDGGVDPYEKNRVAAAMATMVRDGKITSEQMIEASRAREGDIWDAAVQLSASSRFISDSTSFFLGAGIRPRTQDDMVIEKFWQDYGVMIASSSMMSADKYRQAWDNMRDNPEYGMFMDALLLSRKSGNEQDTAYAYNVFGRIPPGRLNDVAQTVGIEPGMIQAFYDSKGDFETMGLTNQDLDRFMAGVADIGAILAAPSNTTRQDWIEARAKYNRVNEILQQQFGQDILDKMNEYWDDSNKSTFLEMNPDVQAALQMQDQIILTDPTLNLYYGGISKLEKYYSNATDRVLIQEFGQETADLVDEYNDPTTSIERGKEIYPQIKAYNKRKAQLKEENFKAVSDIAQYFPDEPRPELRSDANPQGVSQNDLAQLSQPPMSYDQWKEIIKAPMASLIEDYKYNGTDLPYAAQKKLDYMAEKQGYFNGDEMLQAILRSMPQ